MFRRLVGEDNDVMCMTVGAKLSRVGHCEASPRIGSLQIFLVVYAYLRLHWHVIEIHLHFILNLVSKQLINLRAHGHKWCQLTSHCGKGYVCLVKVLEVDAHSPFSSWLLHQDRVGDPIVEPDLIYKVGTDQLSHFRSDGQLLFLTRDPFSFEQ